MEEDTLIIKIGINSDVPNILQIETNNSKISGVLYLKAKCILDKAIKDWDERTTVAQMTVGKENEQT